MKGWRYVLAGIALGAGIAAGALLMWRGIRRGDEPPALSATDGRRLFETVLNRVERSWVDSIETDELFRRAAMGLVAQLGDPSSEYLDARRLERLREATAGTYSGVGMSLDRRDGWLVVTFVRVGTPAERAGITIGDRLVDVDGKSLRDMTPDEARAALRSAAGTRLSIIIERGSAQARIPVSVERDEIHVSAVSRATLLNARVGYFGITMFNDSTAADVQRTMDSLTTAGARAFVVDLRGNPGGLLSQGVAVAELFLDKGQRIASTRGWLAASNVEYVDKEPQTWGGRPLVMLVNGNTASAAEVVVGALQDHDRALLMGRQTYGKGSAQAVLQLDDGGGLKLTSARWYTPLGRSIERPHTVVTADAGADTTRPVFHTAGGRVMTGGGGIRPDIVSGDSVLSIIAERAWVRAIGTRVTPFRQALTEYAGQLIRAGRVTDPLFEVDRAMRDGLYGTLRARGVDVPRAVFDDVRDLVDRVLGQEAARIAFGIPGAQQRAVRTDLLVARALSLLEGVETAEALIKRVSRMQAADDGT
ncbi:MAG: S41 family peptidase [Gemmatimonadetes bacterium]|nr:S41 family peptidase [Gemmatimonadota bacterium]